MFISGRYYNVIGRFKNARYACVFHGIQNNIKFFKSEKNCIKYYNDFCNASSVLLIRDGDSLYRALIYKWLLLYDTSSDVWGIIED